MGRLAGMNWRDGWRCFLMDEEIERLVVSVRADTQGFASDVAAMREELDGPLGDSVGRAGALIENALSRAVRTGKLGFEDLRQVAARAMAEIARWAVSGGIGSLSDRQRHSLKS